MENLIKTTKNAMSHLCDWFSANGLKLNNTKTKIMKFQTHQNIQPSTFNFSFQNLEFSTKHEVNFLGLQIDNHLDWSS